jgi:hypothetical protein
MTSEDLETLRRWEDFGGAWEVAHRTTGQVTLSLLRCDGGEEVIRMVSQDPEVLHYTQGRERSS